MPDSAAEQVALVVELRVKSERVEEMLAELALLSSATRSLDRGVVRFDVALDPSDPTRVLGFEIWASQAALDEHAGQPHTVRFLAAARELTVNGDEPLSATRWRPLRNEAPMAYPAMRAGPPADLPPGFAHRSFDVGDAELHGVVGGSGPPLVLLHGFPNTWYSWREVMPQVAEEHTIVALDLRGLGDSQPGERPNDVVTGAEDVRAVVDILDRGPVAIAGQDWGGSTAFAFACANPEMTRRLAVLEAMPAGPWTQADAARGGVWFADFHQIPVLPELLVQGHEQEYLAWFYSAFSSTPDIPIEAAVEEYLRCYVQPHAMRSAFARYRGVAREIEHNGRHLTRPLAVPVLAIGGEDVFGAAVAENLRHAASDVRQVVLTGAGHYLTEERPHEIADLLRAFARS